MGRCCKLHDGKAHGLPLTLLCVSLCSQMLQETKGRPYHHLSQSEIVTRLIPNSEEAFLQRSLDTESMKWCIYHRFKPIIKQVNKSRFVLLLKKKQYNTKRAELLFQRELRRNYPWKQSAKLTKQTPRERQTAGILHKPALLCTRAVASRHPTSALW